MMKPGIGAYDKFKRMFDKYSAEAGKKQYLVPYFIAAHPGTSDADMMNLAVWLKRNGFRADQVQTFYPSPMATATAMYHSGRNPLRKVRRAAEADGSVDIVRGEKRRRLHKAFLRYHDPANWPLLREALGLVTSAHDLADGGLAQCLAESSLRRDVGCTVDLARVHADPFVALFSESAGRVLLTVPDADLDRLTELADRLGVPATVLGRTGGDAVVADGRLSVDLAGLREAWTRTLPDALG